MREATDQFRHSQDALLDELRNAGAVVKRPNAIRCPFHADGHPSASVHAGDDGIWRFKCHACGWYGDIFDVRAHTAGKPIEDVLREAAAANLPVRRAAEAQPAAKVWPSLADIEASYGSRLDAVYRYTDPDSGAVDLAVVRYIEAGRKSIMPYIPHSGGWIARGHPEPRPLYNRTRVRASGTVVVVEGEKCVHILDRLGIVATTSPSGSKAAGKADWAPLAGKSVYIWPDADDPGAAYARDVAGILSGLAQPPTVRMVDPAALGLSGSDDVEQYIARYATLDAQRDAVRAALQGSMSTGGSADLERHIEDVLAGKWRSIPWPWSDVDRLTSALLPKTITLLCGTPGSGKTFLLLQAAAMWVDRKVPVALYTLEGDRTEILARVLAQTSRDANLYSADWMREHPDDTREAYAMRAEFLDTFAQCVAPKPDQQPDLVQIGDWIEAKAEQGTTIIIIDPVTVAASGKQCWEDDKRFMARCVTIAGTTGCRIILSTHPRVGCSDKPALDALSGGSAYSRQCTTALWLRPVYPAEEISLVTPCGRIKQLCNRRLQVLKARHGVGTGSTIGMMMSKKTLCFDAMGTE